jgi:hypothetical protein
MAGLQYVSFLPARRTATVLFRKTGFRSVFMFSNIIKLVQSLSCLKITREKAYATLAMPVGDPYIHPISLSIRFNAGVIFGEICQISRTIKSRHCVGLAFTSTNFL